ncbi:hypothetical protein SARC_00689 [Sphaeroforma arctica JP610]|uniref:DSBA-like thioredoxin domain-containing protein n=1 Tax=Sphaeroforma arctica JP610 TaxID=667725 RepID=A0A0L0GE57_9EUKA|nr:hypothetical protein SARC_00689 [Sphaeroforma arctica JP610]KNC87161.1 hypothetical protein SARC_00689 [Sphaeroforma arctica JP610]|eukprot:XP_014161063.1 hypothetical protein SARC_00689 [Sphaeroforma arctica JP610]
MAKVVYVEVVSDHICPFCYVGKKHLEEAIKACGDEVDVHVRWLPYMLKPDVPTEGIAVGKKSGGNKDKTLANMGKKVGIKFTGKASKTPNTTMAHSLKHYALEELGSEAQTTMQEKLFKSHFTSGAFLGDVDVLVRIAKECGLDGEQSREYILSKEAAKSTQKELDKYKKLGISSVPSYVMNGSFALKGAESPEAFVNAFRSCPGSKSWVWSNKK